MPKLFVCQDKVQFVSEEVFDAWFVPKGLESMLELGGITSCGLDRASEIAFCINLPVFSCTAVYAYVIFVMSPDTLSMELINSCVIKLNCCKITVYWS